LRELDELCDLESHPWTPEARAVWESWRTNPATTLWLESDTYYALDTLRMLDLNLREPRSSVAGEVRLRMDGLGLTAKGKRNLRWRMADPAEVVEHPTLNSSRGDQRRLKAIDTKGT
jgi:hypothetical protein